MRRNPGMVAAVCLSLALTFVGSVAVADSREEVQEEVITSEEIQSSDSSSYKDPNAPPAEPSNCTDSDWAAANKDCLRSFPGCYVATCSRISSTQIKYGARCPGNQA